MKKILLFASALASLFLAGSCQRENLEPVEQTNTVTYTVKVADAIATKALGDDVSNVNTLHYEVYRTAAAETVTFTDVDRLLYHKTATVTNGTAKIELELVNDQNFTVLFWAQVEKDGFTSPYVVGDLRNVSIKDPSVLSLGNALKANQVDYAAFSGVDFIKATEVLTDKTVSLTRPVAQLNLATTYESLKAFKTPVTLEGSYVKVSGLSKTFDVAKQVASAADFNAEYEYTEHDVPAGALVVANKEYKYAGMNYVGFAAGVGTPVTVKYILNTTEGNIENTIENVPVKPNFRTNIIGNLITSKTNYTIELDETWGTPEEVVNVVNTATGLQEAINKSGEGVKTEIKLEGDINLGDLAALLATKSNTSLNTLSVPAGKSIVLNLNGYSISGVDETSGSYGLINNKGNLTIVNKAKNTVSAIRLKATNDREFNNYSSVISTQPGSTLLVGTGVEVEHLGGTAMAYAIDILTNGKGTSVEAVIDGATLKSTYRPVRQFLNGVEANNSLTVNAGSVIKSMTGNKAIWMQDPSKNANSGSLVVEEGAEIYGNVYLSVTAGSTEWPVSVSVKASALKEGATVETNANVPGYKLENLDGEWKVNFYPVAKIGEKGYVTLNDAVAAVQDGETITLVANETFTETNCTHNSGTWYDGLYYIGDKSFTIDLNGFTVAQDGAVNDYLLNFKNDGAKANVITLKNGTVDAGTAAFCALCTSGTSTQELTINLEDVNLINNVSNGSTLKIRGAKTTLNVKSGTKITGKNSYLGIESWQSTINIYDGAEIYMNGTSSYNGCLVGVGGNGVANVYGGYGKGVKGVFIAMTSGGTINVAGGEWIANTDGTVGDNSNVYVLTAQNNKYEGGYAGPSIINVTGGTFRGGMDAWILNDVNVEKAELNISGGNFNADPKAYLVDGFRAVEDNGIYTVSVAPVAKIGETEYASLQEAFNVGGDVTLLRNVTITETATLAEGKSVVLDLNDKTISGTMHKNDGCVIKNNGTMTIKNGTISSTAANGGSAVQNYGTLQIENTLINGADREGESWPSYPINNYANMTLNKVTVYGNHGVIACNAAGKTILTECNLVKNYMKTSSHVFYINHADAEVIVHSGTYAHNGFDGSLAYVNKGMITVNGGTFTTKDGGYGMAALSAGTIIVNGGTLPTFLNWGGTITDNR